MRHTTIFVAALAIGAGRVAAQDNTTDTADATATDTASGADATPTGFPPCANNCALSAIGSSGCAPTDVNCICASPFILAITQCVATSCNAADQASAEEYASELCAKAGPVASSSASASSAVASLATSRAAITSAASTAAAAARSSVSQSIHSSASVVSASASASRSGNAATAIKMPSASFMVLGATALGFVVGPLLLFA